VEERGAAGHILVAIEIPFGFQISKKYIEKKEPG
jgi:hypothetical protein